VLVQAFPRIVCGQDRGRLSRCRGRTKQFASLKQTSARQRERQFGAGPLRASLTPWLHSSAFPRAHHRRNSSTDAAACALMRHRPPRSASARASTRGVGQTLAEGGRRRAPSPASATAGRSANFPPWLPPPASEIERAEKRDAGMREAERKREKDTDLVRAGSGLAQLRAPQPRCALASREGDGVLGEDEGG
jgi:hypothetical protein